VWRLRRDFLLEHMTRLADRAGTDLAQVHDILESLRRLSAREAKIVPPTAK
jgi:hypothetical protein